MSSTSLECPSCGKRTVTQSASTHLYRCARCHGEWSRAMFLWLVKNVVKTGMEAGK